MISDAQVEQALAYLSDQAVNYGRAVGLCKALDHRRKVIAAQSFLEARGSVAARQATAETSEAYKICVADIEDAETDKATIATLLKHAELTIDVWRTQQASSRKGHL